jgi:hypothetical protein
LGVAGPLQNQKCVIPHLLVMAVVNLKSFKARLLAVSSRFSIYRTFPIDGALRSLLLANRQKNCGQKCHEDSFHINAHEHIYD